MGCCIGAGGTACRLADGALGLDCGADQLREPRLPVDLPPPARAQASSVHKQPASSITTTLVNTTVRLMCVPPLKVHSSSPGYGIFKWSISSQRHHIQYYTIAGASERSNTQGCMALALWNRLDTSEAALLRFASRNHMLDMLGIHSYTNYVSPFDLRTYTHARRVIRAKSYCCCRSRHEGPAYARQCVACSVVPFGGRYAKWVWWAAL